MNNLPTTRKAARQAGVMFYFTGKPCKFGHVCERYARMATCLQCKKRIDAEYLAKNREKNRLNCSARYYQKREEQLKKGREYRKAHRVERAANNKKWAAANHELMRAYRRKWERNNPEKLRANCQAGRARRKGAEGRYTAEQEAALLKKQKYKCVACGTSIKKKHHADHIVPIALGGTNWISNIQLLCPTCNWRKTDKDPIHWAQQDLGRLL